MNQRRSTDINALPNGNLLVITKNETNITTHYKDTLVKIQHDVILMTAKDRMTKPPGTNTFREMCFNTHTPNRIPENGGHVFLNLWNFTSNVAFVGYYMTQYQVIINLTLLYIINMKFSK